MSLTIGTLEELARALQDKTREFVLEKGLAGLIAECARDGQAKVLAGLAKRFDRGQAELDRELRKELGGDAPQKAKDLMRGEALAAMEKLLGAVLARIKDYDSKDAKRYVRR
ncbi:MAG: hypothetical protein HQK81_15280 [Desulfovibrionaceae bacterium]|nr:hypothetical protein [Desulfovibrionaceae bacterium]MBF0515406.1 hypothetical protein [Desulfovibrionaceae bacterium]